MAPIAHPGPPKYRPPIFDGRELHVHPHRSPSDVTSAERALVCLFLKRYVLWCARAWRCDRLRNALDLLNEVAAI
ncbi:MAG: hypothetical protein M3R40_05400 [Pseudomonadota bacterium]|nr:hypothetical protein [Pseudomonadota bacterium]